MAVFMEISSTHEGLPIATFHYRRLSQNPELVEHNMAQHGFSHRELIAEWSTLPVDQGEFPGFGSLGVVLGQNHGSVLLIFPQFLHHSSSNFARDLP